MKTQTSPSLTDYKQFSSPLTEIKSELYETLLFTNDLNVISANQLPYVLTGLVQLAVNRLLTLPNYIPFPRPSINYSFNWNRKTFEIERFLNNEKEFNTRILNHYYTPDAKEAVIEELQYLITKEIQSMTDVCYFDHPIMIEMINSHVLKIGIHQNDLEVPHDSSICNGFE